MGSNQTTIAIKRGGDKLDYRKLHVDDDGSLYVVGVVTGTFSATGLTIGGRITTIDITDTVTTLPPTSLTDRNSLSVHNTSTSDSVYVGYHSGITADNVLGTTSGWLIGPDENFNIDITEHILLYAICATGKTCRVKINEVA